MCDGYPNNCIDPSFRSFTHMWLCRVLWHVCYAPCTRSHSSIMLLHQGLFIHIRTGFVVFRNTLITMSRTVTEDG